MAGWRLERGHLKTSSSSLIHFLFLLFPSYLRLFTCFFLSIDLQIGSLARGGLPRPISSSALYTSFVNRHTYECFNTFIVNHKKRRHLTVKMQWRCLSNKSRSQWLPRSVTSSVTVSTAWRHSHSTRMLAAAAGMRGRGKVGGGTGEDEGASQIDLTRGACNQ